MFQNVEKINSDSYRHFQTLSWCAWKVAGSDVKLQVKQILCSGHHRTNIYKFPYRSIG